MRSSKIIPQISFKGVFIFVGTLFIGTIILSMLLRLIFQSEPLIYFLSAGISASLGGIIVLTKVDAKSIDRPLFKKRIILAIVVGFVTSALMTFVFGGDILG
ncbi:hypothetical protein [Oceanobacillus sp. 1P07AA]|uniref:hypothetical protein n=1 Tax=Oceanobacillus sp. 1P07AA TaxID=3132293 RepID=UPI0039A6FDFF